MQQFNESYPRNIERYCMTQFGLEPAAADSFTEMTTPRVADIFLTKLNSVGYAL